MEFQYLRHDRCPVVGDNDIIGSVNPLFLAHLGGDPLSDRLLVGIVAQTGASDPLLFGGADCYDGIHVPISSAFKQNGRFFDDIMPRLSFCPDIEIIRNGRVYDMIEFFSQVRLMENQVGNI